MGLSLHGNYKYCFSLSQIDKCYTATGVIITTIIIIIIIIIIIK